MQHDRLSKKDKIDLTYTQIMAEHDKKKNKKDLPERKLALDPPTTSQKHHSLIGKIRNTVQSQQTNRPSRDRKTDFGRDSHLNNNPSNLSNIRKSQRNKSGVNNIFENALQYNNIDQPSNNIFFDSQVQKSNRASKNDNKYKEYLEKGRRYQDKEKTDKELMKYVEIRENELEGKLNARKQLENEIKDLEKKIREKFNVDDSKAMFKFDNPSSI